MKTLHPARAAVLAAPAAIVLALAAGVAPAETIVLTADRGPTKFDFDITIDAFLIGDATATASTPAGGTVTIEVDNPANPTTVSIIDIDLESNETLPLVFDFGFTGMLAGEVPMPTVYYDGEGPTDAGSVGVAGGFMIAETPIAFTGAGEVTGNLLIVGDLTVPFNLADAGTLTPPTEPAMVEIGDGEMVLTAEITFSETQPVDAVTDLTVAGTITIVARAEVETGPTPCNNADLAAPFGTLNFADVQSFLGQFNAQGAPADLAAPAGVFNFADVQTFLGLFNAGC